MKNLQHEREKTVIDSIGEPRAVSPERQATSLTIRASATGEVTVVIQPCNPAFDAEFVVELLKRGKARINETDECVEMIEGNGEWGEIAHIAGVVVDYRDLDDFEIEC